MFHVGDEIIGTAEASNAYAVTKEGWIGKVIRTTRTHNGQRLVVFGKEHVTFYVDPKYFAPYPNVTPSGDQLMDLLQN